MDLEMTFNTNSKFWWCCCWRVRP